MLIIFPTLLISGVYEVAAKRSGTLSTDVTASMTVFPGKKLSPFVWSKTKLRLYEYYMKFDIHIHFAGCSNLSNLEVRRFEKRLAFYVHPIIWKWRTHVCQKQYFLASSAMKNVIRVHQRNATKISWRENLPWQVFHIILDSKLLQAETTGEQQSIMHPKPLSVKEVVLQRKNASSERKGLLIKSLPFHICPNCHRICASRIGLTSHVRACKKHLSPDLRMRGTAIIIIINMKICSNFWII